MASPRLTLTRGSMLLAFVIALVVFGQFAVHVVRCIACPDPFDYGEGPLLDQVQRLARFENVYALDLDHPPYTISSYPPLYLVAQLPFAWAFGPAYWYGRLINAAGLVCTAF